MLSPLHVVGIFFVLVALWMLFSRLTRSVEPFQHAAAMSVGNVDVPRVSSTWRTDEVSKILHQTAPSDESKWHPIWAKCQATWKAKFPNHTYMFWNDQDIDTFIQTKFPKFYPAFKNYPHHIQRVDVARYSMSTAEPTPTWTTSASKTLSRSCPGVESP